jgi:hypothetical protein
MKPENPVEKFLCGTFAAGRCKNDCCHHSAPHDKVDRCYKDSKNGLCETCSPINEKSEIVLNAPNKEENKNIIIDKIRKGNYQLIIDRYTDMLIVKVNEHIRTGWTCQGGPIVTIDNQYCQAMIFEG